MSHKVKVESTIDLEVAAMMDAEDLVKIHKIRLSNNETRRSFYMQELQAASIGDKCSREWVKSKGIDPAQYKNALDDEDEDAEKIQLSSMMTAISYGFETKDRAAYKCYLIDSMMEQSEDFINVDK